MDIDRLYKILRETTVQLRKGEAVHGAKHLVDAINAGRDLNELPGGVVAIDAMPPVEAAQPWLELVDLVFIKVGVQKDVAARYRDELIEILKTYPEPERLAGGPSYIEMGGVLGDQGAAFQLFALGKVLGLWEIVTPGAFGFKDEAALEMAGKGFIMIAGYKAAGK